MSTLENTGLEFRRLLVRAVALPLALMALLAAVMLFQVSSLMTAARWLDHTDQVIAAAVKTHKGILESQSIQRGYLLLGTHAFVEEYQQLKSQLARDFAELLLLTGDNPRQIERLELWRSDAARWLKWSDELMDIKTQGGNYLEFLKTLRGQGYMREVQSDFDAIVSDEEGLRAQRVQNTQAAAGQTFVLTVGLAFTLSLVVGIASQFQLKYLSEIYRAALEAERKSREELRSAHDELETRVSERTQDLQSANRELEAFSYSVSHDLRAPLRGIDGFSQALMEDYGGKLDVRGLDYLKRVRAGTQRMGQLIDDILKLSRLTRAPMSFAPVDLSALARKVIDELKCHEPERRVKVSIAPGLVTNGDPGLLAALMENLLSNAWKFTGKKENARIELGHVLRSGKDMFYVRDNGAGFDMAYSDKLFGAFQRLHSAVEFAGSGVGLATARRIVMRHGGEIEAEAQVGRGATFYFTVTPGQTGKDKSEAA